jgi:Uma2 family endonuclease
MSVMPVMPREGEWTVEDLDRLPDDGLRYELLDGMLLVTPAPTVGHQRALGRLVRLLDPLVPERLELLFAPTAYRPDADRRTSLEPDLMVFRPEVAGYDHVPAMVLAIEILSPSTRRKDLVLKRSKYEESGVEHYWIVDPVEPSVTALSLVDGRYVEIGRAVGGEKLSVTAPFEITLVAADLVR